MDKIRLDIETIKFDHDFIDQVNIIINGSDLMSDFGIERFIGLPPEIVFSPSRHLLDKPHTLYKLDNKPVIYLCGGCGDFGCCGALVNITISDDTVIWDLEEIAAGGAFPTYDTYTFDRIQYESELSKKYTVKREFLLHYEDNL